MEYIVLYLENSHLAALRYASRTEAHRAVRRLRDGGQIIISVSYALPEFETEG